MALLTEEQIKQLLKMASVTSTARSYHEDLCEWNEKQNPQQIEIDWGNAPKCAVSAVAHVAWVTKIGNWVEGYEIAKFERPAPVITPHPHAEMMAKYAEVAARRVDPWVEFQVYSYPFNYWVTLEAPTFFDSVQRYRHIGDDK